MQCIFAFIILCFRLWPLEASTRQGSSGSRLLCNSKVMMHVLASGLVFTPAGKSLPHPSPSNVICDVALMPVVCGLYILIHLVRAGGRLNMQCAACVVLDCAVSGTVAYRILLATTSQILAVCASQLPTSYRTP